MTDDIIDVCQPDATKKIYIVGGASHRVSLHTQQRRILSLIQALERELKSCESIAVVGGGVAGVTAAAGLLALGKSVSIFEKSSTLLSLQSGNKSRFVHPNAVSWPLSPDDVELPCSTNLPFLNWHSGHAFEVAEEIKKEFDRFFKKKFNGRIEINYNTFVDKIEPLSGKYALACSDYDSNSTSNDRFDAVFITTGFMDERKISGYDRHAYWEESSCIPLQHTARRPSIAIVGDGDGAIVDIMRCFWTSEDIDLIYHLIVKKFIDSTSRKKIFEAEKNALHASLDASTANLTVSEAYDYFPLSHNGKKYLESKVIRRPIVKLFAIGPTPYSLSSSPLHKIALSFLMEKKYVSFVSGKVISVEFFASKYTLNYEDSSGNVHKAPDFDRILERIGPAKDFCPVTRTAFDDKILNEFRERNGAKFRFANPTLEQNVWDTKTKYIEAPLDADDMSDLAAERLLRYLRQRFEGAVLETSCVKNDDGQLALLVRHNGSNDAITIDGPRDYGAFKVKYEKSSASRPRFAALKLSDENQFSSQIFSGSAIKNISRNSSSVGRASFAVKKNHKKGHELDNRLYLISLQHILNAELNDKVGFSTGNKFQRFGKITNNSLLSKIFEDVSADDYSCLSDIQVVTLDSDAKFVNKWSSNTKNEIVSIMDHFLKGDSEVYISGINVGFISRIHSHVELIDDGGRILPTEAFVVRTNEFGSSVKYGYSGSVIHTVDGKLLGILVACAKDEIYCLEAKEIVSKLDCHLA